MVTGELGVCSSGPCKEKDEVYSSLLPVSSVVSSPSSERHAKLTMVTETNIPAPEASTDSLPYEQMGVSRNTQTFFLSH